MTAASIETSQSMVTMTRKPGSAYGIHVSACVHARSEAASSAGQRIGITNPDGHTPRNRVANHKSAMAVVPYNIGNPAKAAFVIGSVNLRAENLIERKSPSIDAVRFLDVAQRCTQNDRAVADHCDVIRDLLHFIQQMRREQHRASFIRDRANDSAENVAPNDGIETRRRL